MPKTDRLEVRLSPDLKEKLQSAAEKEGRSVSNYVENLIRKAMKEAGL